MLQAPVNEHYVVVKFLLMQNSEKKNLLLRIRTCYSKFRAPRLHLLKKKNTFHIRYAHVTRNDGVTSNLYIFMVFNTKEFRIMAASIGGDFHVFRFVLKLIQAVYNKNTMAKFHYMIKSISICKVSILSYLPL
jgi:hypothetical protein